MCLTTLTLTFSSFFFFDVTLYIEIYTLSLHDALPISCPGVPALCSCETRSPLQRQGFDRVGRGHPENLAGRRRSEEHTSELQSRPHLVCRLLLEKKKQRTKSHVYYQPNSHTHPRVLHP